MPKFHGRALQVWIDDSSAAERELSGDVSSIDVPLDYDSAEVTGFGNSSKNYVLGNPDSAIVMEGQINSDANKSHAVLSGLLGGTTPRTLIVDAAGSTAGNPRISGEVLLTSYEPTLSVDAHAGYRASFVPADATGMAWGTTP